MLSFTPRPGGCSQGERLVWLRGLLAGSWPDRRPGLRRLCPCRRTGSWGNGVKYYLRCLLLPRVFGAQRCAAAMKFLLAFDFDHTIIDENSDTWIVKCAPQKKLPNGLRNSYRPGYWTEYMGRVFVYLGDNGVKEDVMKRTMTTIPFTAGMIDLLGFIGENKELFDCIILSDSNTVFIDWILQAADFHKVFDEVFTNPAAFSSTGYLTVQGFHTHHCAKCPKNLCKREVLKEFLDKQLEQGVSYTQVVYIGDGGNDLCPIMFLKKGDIAMPRQGYTLEKKISQLAQNLSPVECSVVVWSSAIDIMSYLKLLIKE